MKTSRLLAASAACAALALTAAACGDDDDDASGDTTLATIAPTDETTPGTAAGGEPGPTTTGAAAATAAPGTAGPTTTGAAAGTAPAGTGAPTAPAGTVSPEVAADCQLVFETLQEATADVDLQGDPEVGGEISDEYKDGVQSLVDAAEDLELSSDEVQEGVDALVAFGNEVIDADTWTEEMQTASQDAFTPLTNACASAFAQMATATTGA
jgi:hypothetical protein